MRRRSSHLVFVVLLLCSVQLSDDFTLRLANGTISRRSNGASQRRISALPASEVITHGSSTSHLAVTTRLDPAAWTAHRTPWTMRRPARAAASISHHTGLLRA